MDISVEKMRDDDWPVVRAIYQEGIDTGNATFETEALNGKNGTRATCKIADLLLKPQGGLSAGSHWVLFQADVATQVLPR